MNEVFVKRENKVQSGYNMCVVMNRKATKGEVGIEIEVEGNKFPKPPGQHNTHTPCKLPGSTYWSYVHDGSLRGFDNAEYLLTKPVDFSKAPEAVTEIFTMLKEFGSIIDDSNRTSVHVHLNCQEFHLNRLTSLMALWFTFEEVLTAWCGEHRVGNLFCLRAKDAPAIITQIRRFIKADGAAQLSEHLHYAGFNANALAKYGSVEIRTLRGCTDAQAVLDWISILERLYKLSSEFEDPRDICSLFSAEGPMSFFESVLGDKTSVVRAGIPHNGDMIRDAMYDGVRLAQDLCYCRDWGVFKPVKLKPDPFSRDMKKVAKKLQSENTSNYVSAALNTLNVYGDNEGYPEAPEPEYDPDQDLDSFINEYQAQSAQAPQPIQPSPYSLSQHWSQFSVNPLGPGGTLSNG
jgi:hypothetical protein